MPAALPIMLVVLALCAGTMQAGLAGLDQEMPVMPTSETETVSLPAPSRDGIVSLERALENRRTMRVFAAQPLTLTDISQLLWAMQGITDPDGGRTAPSAGALYPLEIYLAAARTQGLAAGVYRYAPAAHELIPVIAGDVSEALAAAALGQQWLAQAAAVFAIGAVEARTTSKYGTRGTRFVHIEVGHAAQNALLQAAALGLNAAVVGAFDDDGVGEHLHLPAGVKPLYLLPIGRR
jgi:SagB-type dehydrogenase family enzyme